MVRRLLTLIVCALVAFPIGALAQDVDWSEAEELLYRDRPTEAVKVLKPLVSSNPKEEYGYYLLGTAEFESGDFDAADGTFQLGIDEKGRYALNHVGVARVLIQKNDIEGAMEKIDRALYFDKGKSIDVKFAAAKAYLEAGKLKDAEVLLRQAQGEAADDPRSYVMLGDYEYRRGVYEFAMQQYSKAIEIDPKYIPAYTRVGELQINQAKDMKVAEDDEEAKKKRLGLYNEGLQFLNKAIKEDPNYAPSYQVRGDLWMLSGDYTRGRDDYRKYLELQGNDLKAELNYGKFLFLSENYTEAIEQFEKIDTVTGVKLRLLGMSHQKLGDLDKAQKYMDDYFNLKSEDYRIADDYETYGRILLDKRELDQADEYFAKAISMKSDRGVIYEDIAEDFYRQALRINKKMRALRGEKKKLGKSANELAQRGNQLNGEGKIDEAKAAYAEREKVVAEFQGIDGKVAEESAKLPGIYEVEVHYREKAKLNANPAGLQEIMKYGTALYNLGDQNQDKDMLMKADKEFIEAHGLMANYDRPYIRRFQIAQKLTKIDTTLDQGNLMSPVVDKAIEVWGEKEVASLSAKEKSVMLITYAFKAFKVFQDSNNDCAAAQPYIEKVNAIKPNYPTIKGIVDYCEQVQSQGKR